jgi:hypothetical protein
MSFLGLHESSRTSWFAPCYMLGLDSARVRADVMRLWLHVTCIEIAASTLSHPFNTQSCSLDFSLSPPKLIIFVFEKNSENICKLQIMLILILSW